MSDTPPSDPKASTPKTPTPGPSQDTVPEPFVRGRIVWGRPPETVFRTGPLPRPPESWTQPFRPAPPPRPAGSILSGSMIPRAAPSADFDILPTLEPEPVEPTPAEPTPKPRRARKAAAPLAETSAVAAPVEAPPAPDVPVEPPVVEAYAESETETPSEPILETIVEAEPVRPAARPAPAVEIIVEPEAPEQIDTMPPPLSTAQGQTADPRAIPSVVVTPTLYAQVGAVIEKVKTNDTWRIAAVVGALAVTVGFIWLATLPSGDAPPLDMDAPPPAAPGAAAPPAIEAAPVPSAETAPPAVADVTEAPVPVPPARAAPPTETARPARPDTTTATTPTPRIVTPPATVPSTPPVIETAPLIVEPPTAATPPPTDPDAPIETRPQPLQSALPGGDGTAPSRPSARRISALLSRLVRPTQKPCGRHRLFLLRRAP